MLFFTRLILRGGGVNSLSHDAHMTHFILPCRLALLPISSVCME